MNANVTTVLLAVAATSAVAAALWLGLSATRGAEPVAARDSDPLDPW